MMVNVVEIIGGAPVFAQAYVRACERNTTVK